MTADLILLSVNATLGVVSVGLLVALLVYVVKVYTKITLTKESESKVAVEDSPKVEPPSLLSRHGTFKMFGVPLFKGMGQGVPDLTTARSEEEADAQLWERENGEKDDE